MSKINWKAGTMIYPLPAVLVTCGDSIENFNVLTIAWTGTICSDPAMCYISVRKERHSYPIIEQCREFVINLTTEELARATDWCGVKSGREYNKFEAMNLTLGEAAIVKAPIINESPINIECRVKQIVPLGSHDMFIAEVVNVMADETYIDSETGKFELEKAAPLIYSHGFYYGVGKEIGKFGWSVQKKRKSKKNK